MAPKTKRMLHFALNRDRLAWRGYGVAVLHPKSATPAKFSSACIFTEEHQLTFPSTASKPSAKANQAAKATLKGVRTPTSGV